jgi:hypothetical protein
MIIPINDPENAEELREELDKIVKINFIAQLEREGIDDLNLPEPLDTVMLGYVDIKEGDSDDRGEEVY